ncbi:MAG: hypothetical protein R3F30_06560 [Planctomycetota bacterium]
MATARPRASPARSNSARPGATGRAFVERAARAQDDAEVDRDSAVPERAELAG